MKKLRLSWKRVVIFWRQPAPRKIAALVLATWVITVAGFAFNLDGNENKLVRSLFQSWTGDVLFFSIVGALLAIISIARPWLEPFEEKANILFQGQRGSQVDYAKSQLKRLGNYAEESRITILIERDDGDWFRLTSNSTARIRNLIEDDKTTYLLPVSDLEQLENPPGKVGAVLSFTVDGEPQVSLHEGPNFEGRYSVEIGGENAREIKVVRDYWVGRGGFVAHSPARFTKSFTLSVINQLDHSVFLKMDGTKRGQVKELSPRQKCSDLVVLRDVEPLNLAYKFELFRTKREARSRRTPIGMTPSTNP